MVAPLIAAGLRAAAASAAGKKLISKVASKFGKKDGDSNFDPQYSKHVDNAKSPQYDRNTIGTKAQIEKDQTRIMNRDAKRDQKKREGWEETMKKDYEKQNKGPTEKEVQDHNNELWKNWYGG